VSRSTRRLPRSFFTRPSAEVGPDLLGRILVRRLGDRTLLTVRIVEAEAYQEDDPASHSYRGRTSRTEVMFGPPGHAYVYFTYGMHHCINVVTGSTGEGSAVLLRAAEPLEGLEEMARRRGTNDPRALCSGPGRLCQALGIDRAENGVDLVRGRELWLLEGTAAPPSSISVGSRVGITSGIERPWRFFVRGDRFVSRVRPAAPVRGSR
jgi:DNA-3-methyladenine glycosylase